MTGRIPPYGSDFRRESVHWDSSNGSWEVNGVNFSSRMASRRYVLKEDVRFFIWSDGTSEKWAIFFNSSVHRKPLMVRGPYPTLRAAMAFLTGKPESDYLPRHA